MVAEPLQDPPGEEMFDLRSSFALEPGTIHLNHGSFGACPLEVLEVQAKLRARMEQNPMRFFVRELPALREAARERVAAFVDARPDDLVFVENASSAVSAVLRSLDLAPGDELLTTNHAYNACKNALQFVAARTATVVKIAHIALPVRNDDDIVEPILAKVTSKTKLALIDHVTSQSALVFPVERIVRELEARGVDTLVDGAHALGMLPLSLKNLGAAYYTTNAHKWLSAPKTVAVLVVRSDRQEHLVPLSVSHGWNDSSTTRPRLHKLFDWTGTSDPSAALSIPAAIDFFESRWPGGLDALWARNRALAQRARAHLLRLLGANAIAPDTFVGSMASVGIGPTLRVAHSALDEDPLQASLAQEGIETPVFSFGAERLLRVSCHAYTRWSDIEALGAALGARLGLASA